jgi:hypothetical protein
MGTTRCLLVLSLSLAVGYALEAPSGCGTFTTPPEELENLEFGQENRTGNLERFCQEEALMIRREHFWCRGYVDADGTVIDDTEFSIFPEQAEEFWTIFLQFPALSWMDVERKGSVLRIIDEIVGDCGTRFNYTQYCVADVQTYEVTEYRESVLVTLYNLGVDGETFNDCFKAGVLSNDSGNIVLFRGLRALRLTLNVPLADMFDLNIGPASSIGVEAEDPTLRPVILDSFPGNVTLEQAMDSNMGFASNPNPINYGLEDGDIVFAFFGSVLLVILGGLILLGFFIHPFFLS